MLRCSRIGVEVQEVFDLNDVFVLNGVPEVTYVKPKSYMRLRQALKTRGRGIIIEGPSGTGKTTVLKMALRSLGKSEQVEILSARKPGDVRKISDYLGAGSEDDIYIDDFHRLPQDLKDSIADVQKERADEGSESGKIILVGINEAGQSLLLHSHDLNNRIEVVSVGKESDEKVEELIQLGEIALNVTIDEIGSIIRKSRGSFYVAQLLCYEICLNYEVDQTVKANVKVLERGLAEAMSSLEVKQEKNFGESLKLFCKGKKFRAKGRAPYFSVLRWLGESSEDAINLKDEIKKHPEQKASVGQILTLGHLEEFCNGDKFNKYFHYDAETGIFSVEDPSLRFFLKNIDWGAYRKKVGFSRDRSNFEYDFALSFAGADCRLVARELTNALMEKDMQVFFDEEAQADLLGKVLVEELPARYERAAIIIPIVDGSYGGSIWTTVERNSFKKRLEDGEIIPIWVNRRGASGWDTLQEIGGMNITSNAGGPEASEIEEVADTLLQLID